MAILSIATPRILVPLLKNHQQANGSVRLQEALRPYLGEKGEFMGGF
jgi:seryl-tRNA synthetase